VLSKPVKPYDRATRTYDQEIFLVQPSNNAFSFHNLETACYLWDCVIAYEYFLAKADFIYMLYPNVYDYFVSTQWWFETYLCVSSNWMWYWEYPIKDITRPILNIRTCSLDGSLFNNIRAYWLFSQNLWCVVG
jgi:hypothetical protein